MATKSLPLFIPLVIKYPFHFSSHSPLLDTDNINPIQSLYSTQSPRCLGSIQFSSSGPTMAFCGLVTTSEWKRRHLSNPPPKYYSRSRASCNNCYLQKGKIWAVHSSTIHSNSEIPLDRPYECVLPWKQEVLLVDPSSASWENHLVLLATWQFHLPVGVSSLTVFSPWPHLKYCTIFSPQVCSGFIALLLLVQYGDLKLF